MALYTFFLEYEGGTYISQITAKNYMEAPRSWAAKFKLHKNQRYSGLFESDFGKKLVESLDIELITPIRGIINTWSWGAYRLEKPSAIHFTQTVEA